MELIAGIITGMLIGVAICAILFIENIMKNNDDNDE